LNELRFSQIGPLLLLLLLALGPVTAERPRVYAITGATIVASPDQSLESGTIVLREGLITAVGENVEVPPDAVVIEGDGRWVYAGLIDLVSDLGTRSTAGGGAGGEAGGRGTPGGGRNETPAGAVHPIPRVHPEQRSRDRLVPFEGDGAKTMKKSRDHGITTVLVMPGTGNLRGRSTAILLAEERPVSELIVRDDVAQHAAFERGRFGQGYPTSLMGAVATLRQAFLDGRRYSTWRMRYDQNPTGMNRPEIHAAFEALDGVLDGSQPIVFHTDHHQDTLLANRLAAEFSLDSIVAVSGAEWEIADRLAADGRPLIVSIAFPDKPKVEEDEALARSIDEMRRYVEAPGGPKVLHDAGVTFAFTASGLKNSADLPKNMRKILDVGLPESVALAAWTTIPAGLIGLERVLGTLAPGKIANLVVTDGPLFTEGTKVRHVFVDGVEHEIKIKEKPKGDPNAVVDPRGTWSVAFEFGSRTVEREWTISGERDNYNGTAETQAGTVTLDAVELAGNVLTVTFPARGERGTMEITVIIEGESFEGSAEMGPRTVKIHGSRTAGPQGGAR